jgi:hypothetical protein
MTESDAGPDDIALEEPATGADEEALDEPTTGAEDAALEDEMDEPATGAEDAALEDELDESELELDAAGVDEPQAASVSAAATAAPVSRLLRVMNMCCLVPLSGTCSVRGLAVRQMLWGK